MHLIRVLDVILACFQSFCCTRILEILYLPLGSGSGDIVWFDNYFACLPEPIHIHPSRASLQIESDVSSLFSAAPGLSFYVELLTTAEALSFLNINEQKVWRSASTEFSYYCLINFTQFLQSSEPKFWNIAVIICHSCFCLLTYTIWIMISWSLRFSQRRNFPPQSLMKKWEPESAVTKPNLIVQCVL